MILENVTVIQAAQRCSPVGSHAAVAADDMRLQGLLIDSDASVIEITRDVTLQASRWQVSHQPASSQYAAVGVMTGYLQTVCGVTAGCY